MIKINLLPHKRLKPIEKGLLKLRAIMVVLNVVILLGLGYAYFQMHSTLADLRSKNEKAARELDVLKGKVKEAEEFERSRLELETKLNIIQQLEKRRVPLTPFLNEINRVMGKDVWLTDLEKTGISFTMEGLGRDSDTSVNTFALRVKDSPVFKDTELDDVKEVPSKMPGVSTYSFKITGKLAGYAEEAKAVAPPASQGKGKKEPSGNNAPAGKPQPVAPKAK